MGDRNSHYVALYGGSRRFTSYRPSLPGFYIEPGPDTLPEHRLEIERGRSMVVLPIPVGGPRGLLGEALEDAREAALRAVGGRWWASPWNAWRRRK